MSRDNGGAGDGGQGSEEDERGSGEAEDEQNHSRRSHRVGAAHIGGVVLEFVCWVSRVVVRRVGAVIECRDGKRPLASGPQTVMLDLPSGSARCRVIAPPSATKGGWWCWCCWCGDGKMGGGG